MIKLGNYNTLRVSRNVDFGSYLDGGAGVGDILLPARYITEPLHPGDEIEVFIYRDNEGRLIATTEHPFAQVGEFAFLQVIFLAMFFSDSADEAVIRTLNIFEDIQIMSIPKSVQLKRN